MVIRDGRRELTSRWLRGAAAPPAAVRAWLAGRSPRPEGLGLVDGRTDLRGLQLAGPSLTFGDPTDPAAGVRWEALDLSYAHMDSLRLFGAHLEDCLFRGANLVDLRLWGATATGLGLERADLRQSILGSGLWCGRKTIWTDVQFDRAKMSRSTFTGAELRRCSFDTPGRLLQLQDCVIENCTFSGVLDSLLIDGRGHRSPVSPDDFSADFSGAVFRNAHVTGYRLRRATLPRQADLLVLRGYPMALTAAADWAETRGTTDADRRAALLMRRLAAAPGEDLDRDICLDLGGLDDPALSEAVAAAVTHSLNC